MSHNRNSEVPPFQCHVLYSFSLYHSYIQTVTEQTAADILCAVKCWMIILSHNKPITVHMHFIALHITTKLCPALPHTHILPGKSGFSDDPKQHKIKIHQFSPLLTCRIMDAQNLNSLYTDCVWKDIYLNFRLWSFKWKRNIQFTFFDSFITLLSLYITNDTISKNKTLLNNMCISVLPTMFVWKILHSKNNSARYFLS